MPIIPSSSYTNPDMNLYKKQINDILQSDNISQNNLILSKQIFNRSMQGLQFYNQDNADKYTTKTTNIRPQNNE